jgi:hypothetical protein
MLSEADRARLQVHLDALRQAHAAIHQQLQRLDFTVKRAADDAWHEATRHAPWLYFPSRLAKATRRAAEVQRVREDAAARRRELIADQDSRLRRKLARLEATIRQAETTLMD